MPRIPIGIWQLWPEATSISPLEFSPQSANVIDIEHSGTGCAEDAGVTFNAKMSARAATPDVRVVTIFVFMQSPLLKVLGAGILQRGSRGGKGFGSPARHVSKCLGACCVVEAPS